MALTDWYEIKDTQTRGTVTILNVYHVMKLAAPFNALSVLTAYQDWVMPPMVIMQTVDVTHTVLEARNLGDPLDFNTLVPSGNIGLKVGSPFAQFTALTIQFNRKRTDMKHGQKRFLAGSETDSAGAEWDAPFLVEAQALGDVIVLPWEEAAAPGVDVCRYGILKRVCVGTPPPDPCVKYRLPETDAEVAFHYLPDVALVRVTKRSQVSRKRLV